MFRKKTLIATVLLSIMTLMTACGSEQTTTSEQMAPTSTPTAAPETPPVQPAEKASIVGSYKVDGVNLNGSKYSGTLDITAEKSAYKLVWQVGKPLEGAGILQGDILSVAWGKETCTAVSYVVNSDGSLEGQWILVGKAGVGTEKAVRADDSPKTDIAGEYTITGTNPNDDSTYEGALMITVRGPVYQFSWDAGGTFEGIGIKRGNVVSVAYNSVQDAEGEGCSAVSYQVQANQDLDGIWGVYGNNQTTTEMAIRQ